MALFSTTSIDVENGLEVSYMPGSRRLARMSDRPAFVRIGLPGSRENRAYLLVPIDEARELVASLMSTVMLHDAEQRRALESAV